MPVRKHWLTLGALAQIRLLGKLWPLGGRVHILVVERQPPSAPKFRFSVATKSSTSPSWALD